MVDGIAESHAEFTTRPRVKVDTEGRFVEFVGNVLQGTRQPKLLAIGAAAHLHKIQRSQGHDLDLTKTGRSLVDNVLIPYLTLLVDPDTFYDSPEMATNRRLLYPQNSQEQGTASLLISEALREISPLTNRYSHSTAY